MWNIYLVVPEGVAFFPLPTDSSVADADVPESLSLQFPVVGARGEGLNSEDLRPVVKPFCVSDAGPAGFNPGD